MSRLLALGTALLLMVGFSSMTLTAQEGKQDAEQTKKVTESKAKKATSAKKDAGQEKEEPATKKPVAKKAATSKKTTEDEGEDTDVGKAAPAKKATAVTKKAAGAPSGVSASEAAEIRKSTTRLPAYYGQIGLSEVQRQKVIELYAEFRVQSKPHRDQIEELEAQIAKLRADFEKSAGGVLSADQRTKLEQARTKRSSAEEEEEKKADTKKSK